jgi:hypothetical protein
MALIRATHFLLVDREDSCRKSSRRRLVQSRESDAQNIAGATV